METCGLSKSPECHFKGVLISKEARPFNIPICNFPRPSQSIDILGTTFLSHQKLERDGTKISGFTFFLKIARTVSASSEKLAFDFTLYLLRGNFLAEYLQNLLRLFSSRLRNLGLSFSAISYRLGLFKIRVFNCSN